MVAEPEGVGVEIVDVDVSDVVADVDELKLVLFAVEAEEEEVAVLDEVGVVIEDMSRLH